MKIMVLGAAGRLGKAMIRQIDMVKHDPIAMHTSDFDFLECIDQDFDQFLYEYGPDVVINCAAMNGIELCSINKTPAFMINSVGPQMIASACRMRSIPFIHFSTDYVYPFTDQPHRENEIAGTPTGSWYAKTKWWGEDVVRAFGGIVFRVQSIYGNDYAGVLDCISQVQVGMGTTGNPVKVLDQVTAPTSVYSIAATVIIDLVLRKKKMRTMAGSVTNLATQGVIKKIAFAKLALGIAFPGREFTIVGGNLPGRPKVSLMNIQDARDGMFHMPFILQDLEMTLSIMGWGA